HARIAERQRRIAKCAHAGDEHRRVRAVSMTGYADLRVIEFADELRKLPLQTVERVDHQLNVGGAVLPLRLALFIPDLLRGIVLLQRNDDALLLLRIAPAALVRRWWGRDLARRLAQLAGVGVRRANAHVAVARPIRNQRLVCAIGASIAVGADDDGKRS